jgi:TonB family protein
VPGGVPGGVPGRVEGRVRFRQTIQATPGKPEVQQVVIDAVHIDAAGRQRPLTQCAPSATGGNLRAPTKIRDVKPVYPEKLTAGGAEGTVILTATIGADGNVATLDVARSVHPDLDAAAIEAVRQWQFMPALLNCEPTEVEMTVSLTFRPK